MPSVPAYRNIMALKVGTLIEVQLPEQEVRVPPACVPLAARRLNSGIRGCMPGIQARQHPQSAALPPAAAAAAAAAAASIQVPHCHGALLQAPIQATVLSCSSTMLSVRLQELGSEVGAVRSMCCQASWCRLHPLVASVSTPPHHTS